MAVVLISFAVICAICGLFTTLLWIEIVGKVNSSGLAQPFKEWGRPSISETGQVLKLHRQLYPKSRIRMIYWSVVIVMLGAFLAAAGTMLSNIGEHSR